MSVYDQYQLSNSREIPRYQGSAIPELETVAATRQGQYDTAQTTMDATQQAMAQARANPNDPGGQQVLQQLNQEKQAKLAEFSKRGDLENLWRDTMMQAKDYANRYAPIAANSKAIQDWQDKLDKDEKIDPETKAAAKLKAFDQYSGLKYNPETGYSNPFQGANIMGKVDIPEKINKMIADAHPEIRGGKVTRGVEGEWKISNGTDEKTLPMEDYTEKNNKGQMVKRQGIRSIVSAGVNLDPEIKPWIDQQSSLEPYRLGIHGKGDPLTIMSAVASDPTMKSLMEYAHANGGSPLKAAQQYIETKKKTSMYNDILGYAGKGVVDERKTESEHMDPSADKLQQNKLIPMNITVPTNGAAIQSASDYKDLIDNGQKDANAMAQEYENYRSAPNRRFDKTTGQVFEKTPQGEVDVTPQATQMYDGLQKKLRQVNDLRNVNAAAASSAGYDPNKVTMQQQKKADDEYNNAYENARQADMRSGGGNEADQRKIADKARTEYLNSVVPRHAEYEDELKKRLNAGDETSKIWGFADDKTKKQLEDLLTGLGGKGLGLKGGMLGFNIASGPDEGGQIQAKDYDELAGKIEPIGLTHSSKDGTLQIVARATQDIQGKKTKGENMLLSVPDAGWLNEYFKQNNPSLQAQHQFLMDGYLKSGLNNSAGQMEHTIYHADGKTKAGTVTVQRNRGSNSGQNAFNVTVPGPNGPVRIPASTYEDVSYLIDNAEQKILQKDKQP